MLFTMLTVIQGLVAAALVAVILMQRSEGGGLGLGGGGSPGGLMSARGAGDFMTRTTAILAFLFVVLSIALAAVAVGTTSTGEIEDAFESSEGSTLPATEPLPVDPLGAATTPGAAGQAAPAAPAAAPATADPLAGAAE